MSSFGKMIRRDVDKMANHNQIEEFYEHPTTDEVEAMMKAQAEYESAKKIISPKTKER